MPIFQVVIASGLQKIPFEMVSSQTPTAKQAIAYFLNSELRDQLCTPNIKSTQLFLFELKQVECV
ncbi:MULTISPECIES: hypothetical protein [Aeromonas]|uniref:hypothetical protein n=1 Tax=Aeromonas TaxID=642 RepID=UPI00051B8A7F|nr:MULTISPECIES: hypothetical protein [Aeromonas]